MTRCPDSLAGPAPMIAWVPARREQWPRGNLAPGQVVRPVDLTMKESPAGWAALPPAPSRLDSSPGLVTPLFDCSTVKFPAPSRPPSAPPAVAQLLAPAPVPWAVVGAHCP